MYGVWRLSSILRDRQRRYGLQMVGACLRGQSVHAFLDSRRMPSCLLAVGTAARFVECLSAILIFCFVYYFCHVSFVKLVLEVGSRTPRITA
jgi:hypothetical protein